jgi:Fic family protein
MDDKSITEELEVIERVIASTHDGFGISALEAALAARSHPISRRTLQRRLDALLSRNRVRSEGVRRSLVYKAVVHDSAYRNTAESTHRILEARQPEAPDVGYVPLSAAGLEVRSAIRKPLIQRSPVGYNRAFLERYRPNQDFYFSRQQLDRLHELGRTPGEHRPAGTYARNILGRLLIDLSWASSRLEGNTYTLLDTSRLIEQGHAAEGKDARETQMILNHKAAIEMIVENADAVGFNRFTILNLHAILSDNLMADPLASGRIRKCEVGIAGTTFLPLVVPQQIEDGLEKILYKASQIIDPFEQAFFAMAHIPYLQPFEDVNKRVSRLAANIPLVRENLCPLSFVDVPERAYVDGTLGVYEVNRTELLRDVFVWAYERSCQRYLAIRQSIGEPDAFRLKYREALIQTVQDVIRGKLAGSRGEVEALAQPFISEDDMQSFVDAVQTDLDYLYLGNVARYRLRLSEYQQWPFKRSETR